ncbi:MAG: metal ABC transporter substrate-binding protein, partial [Alkalibacterium sp.]
MKQTIKLSLLILVIFLAGCTQVEHVMENEDDRLSVVSTTSFLTDLVETIGGEHVSVTGLMGPGVDPHDYQPSTSDIIAMGEAEIVLYNGLALEERFSEVFDQLGERDVLTIEAADGVEQSDILLESEDEESLSVDPHIWFSVRRWKQVTEYVAEQLSDYDPANADMYRENARTYLSDLDELNTYIEGRVEE